MTFEDYNWARLEMGCRKYFGIDNPRLLGDYLFSHLFWEWPPIDTMRLDEYLCRKYPDYAESDESLHDFISRIYGREALDFVMEFSGMKEKKIMPMFI